MKQDFLTKSELDKMLPWSKNVISGMIHAGIFLPIRNPLSPGNTKMFFRKEQIEEALKRLSGKKASEGRGESHV